MTDPAKPTTPPPADPDDGEVPDVREDKVEDDPSVDHEPAQKE